MLFLVVFSELHPEEGWRLIAGEVMETFDF
jgi:hypothetical protein